ncbi:hypothetical protein ABW19_dt0203127 [Dactylella cylindrospora]|nr:hypothetical protein ABW19_dt0203127 [Dactylella cylindrospora]
MANYLDAGGPDDTPVNHWKLHLVIDKNQSIEIDMQIGTFPEDSDKGRLKTRHLTYTKSSHAVETISLPVRKRPTVKQIFQIIDSGDLYMYRFVNGQGCRHFVRTLLKAIRDHGFITETTFETVEEDIKFYYKWSGGRERRDRVQEGVFGQ